ncbi:MAG TPA: stage V sporulation protein AD [Bacilli bacterium]|nr:stage V sporulation protein AD [Bacilli bacterium]
MASLIFKNVYINDQETVVGPYENNGILNFNNSIKDFYGDEKSFENCEIKLQKMVFDNILHKNNLSDINIDLVVGGDLMNQITATSFNMRDYNIPFLGVYSACASFPESLLILANMVDSKFLKKGIAITSSHNLTSEKQFRFPIEYGCLKPKRSTFTATGAVSTLVSNKVSKVKVESATIGMVIDYGIKDPFNMGAVMAPAAASTIVNHLNELNRSINYYDVVLTGDLGEVGSQILKEFLLKNNNIKMKNHLDAATLIYSDEQETFSGASGPVALPIVLFNKILKQRKYKKILIVGTGSLHSPVMCNQKNTIPSIAHAVSLEVI